MDDATASENVDLQENGAAESGEVGPDGKALKKTYLEIREEARRAILPAHDREKYETMDPDDREFLDAACLFEFNQQQVQKTRRKIKLRDIMLCRDVAQAYCPNRDATGQYSEGKRILKNSEGGNETVRFVLSRKICSMLERIYNLYSSHPRNYVSGDLHRTETELLNYIGRLGKIIRDPLKEARKIYVQLKERTGWEIAPTAFGTAEGCDVPQLFFNRYSDPNQLLLKDPMKPFRSDNLEPPLNLDYRIKNAVLIMAGENRFFVDRKKFAAVRDTATARAIALKSLTEARNKIRDDYEKNTHELAERLDVDTDFNVRSVKEAAFTFFYGYTLQHLPNTAARADAAELMVQQLMAEENDIGCSGFTRWIFPPEAVNDDPDPANWMEAVTHAYRLRKIFHGIGTGEVRLAMFATRCNELVTEYLHGELNRIASEIADPFDSKLRQLERNKELFDREHGDELRELEEAEKRLDELKKERDELVVEAFGLVNEIFSRPLPANTPGEKLSELERVGAKLEEETGRRSELADSLKRKYQGLVSRNNELIGEVKNIDSLRQKRQQNPDDPALQQEAAELIVRVSLLVRAEQAAQSLAGLRKQAVDRLAKIRAGLDKLKAQHSSAVTLKNKLNRIMECIASVRELGAEADQLDSRRRELESLPERLAEIERQIDSVSSEREDTVGRIEEMIEVNQET